MGLLDRHIWKRIWVAQATTRGGLFVYHKKLLVDQAIIMNKTKQCQFCKEEISSSAIKCPKCQSDLRTWARRHPILTFFLILFAIPVSVGIFKSSDDTTPRENLIIPGQTVFIREFTHGAISKEVYNKAAQLEQVSDSIGLQQLYSAEFIFELPKNTMVKVIDTDNTSSFGKMIYQVRALDGKSKGKAGWVAKTDLIDSVQAK